MAAPSSRTKALLDAQRNTYRYGTIELEHDNSDEENNNIEDDFELDHTPAKGNKALPTNKRWSVLEKLDRQYNPRDGGCASCLRNITKRCVLATLMLVAFFVFAWYFTRTLLFNIQLNPDIYDFIIVGGGPTGAVVARRLLDEGATVLLLESGDFVPYVTEEDSYTETSVYGKNVDNTISEFDIPVLWSAVAQKEEVHFGPFNALNINAFRGLGGGGRQSALLYVRALSSDILGWDVSSFDWETMLGVYVQLERFQYSAQSLQPAVDGIVTAKKNVKQETDPMLYRGTQGNFPTHAPGCTDSLGQSFLSASMQQGEPYLPGFNSPASRIGVGCYEVNIDQGVRVSPVKAMLHDYLASTHAKERLTLRTGCTARRLLLDRQRAAGLHIGIITQRKRDHRQQSRTPAPMYRATGVEYVDDKGETKFAYLASGPSQPVAGGYTRDFEPLRCLVLAAGAVHTPVLLMNSGVGPEEQLQKAGVEVKVDSPRVGRDLQDHIAVGLTFQTAASATSDFGSAYAFPQQWSRYTKAVHRAMRRDDKILSAANGGGSGRKDKQQNKKDRAAPGTTISETTVSGASSTSSAPASESTDTETFGLLGDNGVSAGAFLASPWAADPQVPDIQLTLFPAVTEPHFLALMSYKASIAAGNSSDSKKRKAVSFRDQILFTIALLAPDAKFQIVLNETHPLEGPPSVRAVPVRKQDAAEKSDTKFSSTTGSAFHNPPGHDKKKFAPTSTTDDTSAGSDGSDPAEASPSVYNIVPAALTERDVQRLAWAVQRVRVIVRDMRLQDLSALVEVSPGSQVGPASSVEGLSSSSSGGNGTSSSNGEAEISRELAAWVRENAFFQSNWVGSAAMGKSISASDSSGRKSRTLQEGPAISRNTENEAEGEGDDSAGDDDSINNTDQDRDQGQAQGRDQDDQVAGSSVVDEHLSVRNVLALKIADASVIPRVPSGNVQATVQAVAWRAADFILKTFD